jgi:hypothetical protein
MEFIDIPTERTAAVTDVLLAMVALTGLLYLSRPSAGGGAFKVQVWSWALGLLAFAAALGAIAHGFKMSAQLNRLLWKPLNLALGLTVALFVVGVAYDLWGPAIARRALPIMIAMGVAFFAVTVLVPGTFLVFIAYESLAMLFALVAYILLAARGQLHGAAVMALGILVSIVAAAVQANGSVSIKVLWEFDHNGVFHLIQIVGVIVLVVGLRMGLLV